MIPPVLLWRQELLWSGSKVAVLDSDEQRFLEASIAFSSGKPILSDEEYDELKTKLKNSSSIVTAQVRPSLGHGRTHRHAIDVQF